MSANKKKRKETNQNNDFDRNLLISRLGSPDEIELENKKAELGLWEVYAYHCLRCEHVWFPRSVSGYHPGYYKQLLLSTEPPKSCAKCKSKYWNRIPLKD